MRITRDKIYSSSEWNSFGVRLKVPSLTSNATSKITQIASVLYFIAECIVGECLGEYECCVTGKNRVFMVLLSSVIPRAPPLSAWRASFDQILQVGALRWITLFHNISTVAASPRCNLYEDLFPSITDAKERERTLYPVVISDGERDQILPG